MTLKRADLIEHFGDLWPKHNAAFTNLLVACRQHLGSDLDYALILGVVGERTLAGGRNRGISYPDFLAGARGDSEPKPINLHSIAHCTGIPWETARRKVRRLIERGWLEKQTNGSLVVSKQAAVDMAPLTQMTLDYLVSMAREFDRIARIRETATSDDQG